MKVGSGNPTIRLKDEGTACLAPVRIVAVEPRR